MVKRRKFLVGLGALTAGGAAAVGTGAFEGAYIHGDRGLTLEVTGDQNAYLKLIASSQYASYDDDVTGGWQAWNDRLTVEIDRLNQEMDTRLDDVFRVGNSTGAEFDLMIEDSPDWNGAYEDHLRIFAQPPGGGSPVRLDNGGSITLGAGEVAEINIWVMLGSGHPNGSTEPDTLTFTADGTDSNA